MANEIGDKEPPSVSSVYRWCRRYRSGKDTRLLVPRFDLRGSRDQRQAQRLMPLILAAAEEAFKASPATTVEGIHDRLREKIDVENSQSLSPEKLIHPSRRTVYRILHKVDAYTLCSFKDGKHAADNKFRLVGLGVETQHILERVEVDHTPLDLFLIDEQTRLPLGRPTLTVLIDHYSRMLLGYYLSFGHPSTAAVMGALRHAILPKSRLSDEFAGVKIEHRWACYGRPDVLVVDNGLEFHGQDLESVAYDLGIRIQFCPKHEPRFKGVVERFLKTVNYSFAHQLPGTSLARWHLRGDYDPQKHAVLTLAEFDHLFEKWLLDVYAQTLHRRDKTTPWSRWSEGCARRPPELPQDLAALNRRIGLVAQRSVHKYGIELNGIYYNGETLAPILRTYGEGVSVRVLYTPEDLGEIQVWGPDDTEPVTVRALNYAYASGLTALQNDMIRQIVRDAGKSVENKPALENARLQLTRFTEELMVSRKHSDRRRAAKIRGFSSNKPEAPPKPVSKASGPKRPPKTVKPTEQPVNSPASREAYPRFQLKRQKPDTP